MKLLLLAGLLPASILSAIVTVDSRSYPASCFHDGYGYTCPGSLERPDPYPYAGSKWRWHGDGYQLERQRRPLQEHEDRYDDERSAE